MDGQTKRSNSLFKLASAAAILGIAIGGLLPSTVAFGQAMGQAAIDSAAPAPITVATTIPAPALQNPLPAPIIDTLTTPAKTPTVSETKTNPAIAEAKPLPAVLPDIKPETTKPETTTPRPEKIVDSMPPEVIKSAVQPIEKKPIRPNPSESASQESKAPTTTNKDKGPSGASSFIPPGLPGILQVGAALAIVLGLVFLGKALAKKFVPGAKAGSGKGVIEILARYPLSKNQSLVLVRIGSQIVTLNQGKEQSHSVLVINDPTEVAKIIGQIEGTNPKSIQAGFTNLLANARMDLEKSAGEEENDFESRSMEPENLDNQLEEMAAAKRQLMQLRQQVRSVRDSLPR